MTTAKRNAMETLYCNKCEQDKPIIFFVASQRKGTCHYCRNCQKQQREHYQLRNANPATVWINGDRGLRSGSA